MNTEKTPTKKVDRLVLNEQISQTKLMNIINDLTFEDEVLKESAGKGTLKFT